MIIGIPKEIKNNEARVSLTPPAVHELVESGHSVVVQTNAAHVIGFDDKAYRAVGATIVPEAKAVFDQAEMIVKVKEPQAEEIARLRDDHTLFTYLHLAADRSQTEGLQASGATCIAYETVQCADGKLPLLTPMSEVAGRLSIQAAIQHLEIANGGSGVLLGGVSGVAPANVVVIGGGVAGLNAAQMALGLGANVTIFDRSIDRIRELNQILDGRVQVVFATPSEIARAAVAADLVIGAVLVTGAAAPKVLDRETVLSMKPGSVVVDIAIDQGGCFETSKPTTHEAPVYIVGGVTHYCVTNIPAAVARTSTQALTNATLPYVVKLANDGVDAAMRSDPELAAGLNVRNGEVTHPAVRDTFEIVA